MHLIRLATTADGPALVGIYRHGVVNCPVSFELEPPDAEEMTRRAMKVLARTPWLVYESDGHVLGYAYGGTHRERAAYQWSVEVSAYVHPDARKRGIGRALYTSLFAALVVQGFRNAYAGITLPNDASVKLHTSVGFTHIGVYRGIGYKLGAWHDVGWYERALAPRVADPPLPRPLVQCSSELAFLAAVQTGITAQRL
ncbi:MAG: GNAT family N-acetyltransferase [Gemmatimonadaceae bacterium]